MGGGVSLQGNAPTHICGSYTAVLRTVPFRKGDRGL